MNSRDILQLIAEQIDDSVTWCRFSQVSKVCYRLCKQLLKHEVHELVFCCAYEFRTRLPSGVLHGEVRGEKKVYDKDPQILRYEWWYSKTYLSGKLHGYYTVGTVMAEFQNGIQLEPIFFNTNIQRIDLRYWPAYFWKNGVPPIPRDWLIGFEEFEAFTQRIT